jgi:hypothetical protein
LYIDGISDITLTDDSNKDEEEIFTLGKQIFGKRVQPRFAKCPRIVPE